MSREDGINSGMRNVGRFFLFAIPAVLGIAAFVWFGAFIGVANYKHQLDQEKRAATWVGAAERPTEKIKINVIKHDCTEVTRVDLDGESIVIHAVNKCHQKIDYLAWHWQLLSPDKTVIQEKYTNQCSKPRRFGDKAECRMNVEIDDRAESILVWTSKDTD